MIKPGHFRIEHDKHSMQHIAQEMHPYLYVATSTVLVMFPV